MFVLVSIQYRFFRDPGLPKYQKKVVSLLLIHDRCGIFGYGAIEGQHRPREFHTNEEFVRWNRSGPLNDLYVRESEWCLDLLVYEPPTRVGRHDIVRETRFITFQTLEDPDCLVEMKSPNLKSRQEWVYTD